MSSSTGTVIGGSYFQEELIKYLENEVKSEMDYKNEVVSTMIEDIDSLNIAEDSLRSDFDSRENYFNMENLNKIDTDEDINSLINSVNVVNDYNISLFIDTDVNMLININSMNSKMDFNVSNFAKFNNSMNDQILSLNSSFTSTNTSKDLVNVTLENRISSYKNFFDLKVIDFTDADTSIFDTNSRFYSNFNPQFTSLLNKDTSLINKDNQFSSNINSLNSSMDSNFTLLGLENNTITSSINENYSMFIEQFSTLKENDISLNNNFDNLISIHDFNIDSLILIDSTLKSTIDDKYNEFNNVKTDLISVNNFLDTKLNSINNYFDVLNTSLTEEDNLIQNLINTNFSIFETTKSNLNNQDDTINSKIDSLVEYSNSILNDMNNVDNTADIDINSNYSVFRDDRKSLFDINTNFQNTINNFLTSGQEQISTLDDIAASQFEILYDIESNIDSINNDITSRIDVEIATKVNQSLFDEITQELTTENTSVYNNIALLVNNNAQNVIDSTQWELINTKLFNNVYQDQVDKYSTRRTDSDARFLGIEECFRVFLETYVLNKPDNSEYNYTGEYQNIFDPLELPQVFKVSGKRQISSTAWGFVIKLSVYGYNTLLNKLAIVPPNNNGAFAETSIYKQDFNSTTLEYVFSVPNSRDGSSYASPDLPFTIQYKNKNDETFYYIEVTSEDFTSMSDITPINVTYPTESYVFTAGTAITPITPNIDSICGPNLTFSQFIDGAEYPALPANITLNAFTGVISGTPSSSAPPTTYTIQISNGISGVTPVFRTITFSVVF